MDPTSLLLATFLLSVGGLFAFIWSLRKGLFNLEAAGARTIFAPGEVGQPEEPSSDAVQRQALWVGAASSREAPVASAAARADLEVELAARHEADRSSTLPALLMLCCAVVWLVVASAAGLLSSLKLHMPDLLTEQAWLSFGRLRTLHLNAVAYGWAPMYQTDTYR